MKKILITTGVLIFVSLVTLAWLSHTGKLRLQNTPTSSVQARNSAGQEDIKSQQIIIKKLREKAPEAIKFAMKNQFSDQTCFFVDMSIGSNQNRFFVYDLKHDSIIQSGLVTHGRCNENWLEGRKYGNTVGCGCTSLGKYKIGYSYSGRFGLAFKLYGLDKTNDKAFERFVVLHSHSCVPEVEVTDDICQSDGCPTVAPGFLQHLKTVIASSKKPVLLWMFE